MAEVGVRVGVRQTPRRPLRRRHRQWDLWGRGGRANHARRRQGCRFAVWNGPSSALLATPLSTAIAGLSLCLLLVPLLLLLLLLLVLVLNPLNNLPLNYSLLTCKCLLCIHRLTKCQCPCILQTLIPLALRSKGSVAAYMPPPPLRNRYQVLFLLLLTLILTLKLLLLQGTASYSIQFNKCNSNSYSNSTQHPLHLSFYYNMRRAQMP